MTLWYSSLQISDLLWGWLIALCGNLQKITLNHFCVWKCLIRRCFHKNTNFEFCRHLFPQNILREIKKISIGGFLMTSLDFISYVFSWDSSIQIDQIPFYLLINYSLFFYDIQTSNNLNCCYNRSYYCQKITIQGSSANVVSFFVSPPAPFTYI